MHRLLRQKGQCKGNIEAKPPKAFIQLNTWSSSDTILPAQLLSHTGSHGWYAKHPSSWMLPSMLCTSLPPPWCAEPLLATANLETMKRHLCTLQLSICISSRFTAWARPATQDPKEQSTKNNSRKPASATIPDQRSTNVSAAQTDLQAQGRTSCRSHGCSVEPFWTCLPS